MQRIAVLGAGGAGKTVVARRLGHLLGLPVTHLDQLRYDPSWTRSRRKPSSRRNANASPKSAG
jgi:adenylate kinase family enzyme